MKNIEQIIQKQINQISDYKSSVKNYTKEFKLLEYTDSKLKSLESELYSNMEKYKLFKLVSHIKNNKKCKKYPTVSSVMNTYKNVRTPESAQFLLDTIEESDLPF